MRAGGERLAGAVGSSFVRLRYGVADSDAASARRATRVAAAMARIDAELEASGDYLAGDAFSVADLTAAAIMYPIVMPPEGPKAVELPPQFDEYRRSFAERPSYAWIAETFRRHRRPCLRPRPPEATRRGYQRELPGPPLKGPSSSSVIQPP